MPTKAILDVGGVGYGIGIGLSTYSRLPKIGEGIMLYVAHIVREDAQLLFGFLTLQEKSLFEQLIQVSGIGPKTAMTLLGHLEMDDLHTAIATGNTALISKIPGIGKKTAERVIIEMRDKIEKTSSHMVAGERGVIADAISALINLGYPPAQAQKAVKQALGTEKEPQLDKLITLALRQ